MRNPGESSEVRVQSETTSKATARESDRDDCSSPPCKRLKQAVLSFGRLDSSPSTSSDCSKASVSSLTNGNSEDKSHSDEKIKVNGGLVTGAPSPPDVKENSVKPEASHDPAKVPKYLILENGIETTAEEKNASITSSPEAVSSCGENELMIIDQSPPTKVNCKSKVNGGTPLQKSAEKQKRKEEREKERQEKQRLREEKLKEKQDAKAVKEKERLEAKRKRDQERQEKQVEKERKDKERLEKKEKEEKERLEKKEKRDEEKRKRDEEKNAKLEEKRKREADKRSIEEEQERKRQKVQESFAKFFNKPPTPTPKVVLPENNIRFKPFEVKPGMTVAPQRRRELSLDLKNCLDEGLRGQKASVLYLKELDKRKPIVITCTKRKLSTITEKIESNGENEVPIDIDENSNSSIEILEPKTVESPTSGLRCKLLQFHTNYRPAYFGTWRKKSEKISPKNPFKKDPELFDYEVDSDDEWEEEEPGESLSDSEGEEEADGEEDNEDDDGFFVPHGYLSDDEGVLDEEMEDDGESDKKDKNSGNKEDQQLAKAKAWEAEMKRKCKPMKPVTVGCLWLDEASLNLTLKQFAACLLVDAPVYCENPSSHLKNIEVPVDSPSTANNGGLYVPDEAMPELIKLIHGNTAGLNKLISQFRKQWTSKCLGRAITDEEVDEKSPISKRQLEKKIQNIATKERRFDRLRWYVHNHILRSFGLENLQEADGLNSSDVSADSVKTPVSHYNTTTTPSIMQFTRPVSSAVHRSTSPETNNQSPNIKPVDALNNTSSPMEINNTNPLLNTSHFQAGQGSARHNGESTQGMKNNSQIGASSLPTFLKPPTNTQSVTSEEITGKRIETVCID